ncbi:MAG: DUF4384 domain-containing protein [Parafilimonas terrae]|nr:DUF4384 domain-containing protein [Parafilimonas terrae]
MLLKFLGLTAVGFLLAGTQVSAAGGPEAWTTVSQLLDRHCARCHQDGKTTGRFKDRPAGNFGFVLDETKLINRNKLVPGNADGSEVFVKVLKGDMPKDMDDACYDGTQTATTYCGLTKAETVALHDAINALTAPKPGEAVVASAAAPGGGSGGAQPDTPGVEGKERNSNGTPVPSEPSDAGSAGGQAQSGSEASSGGVPDQPEAEAAGKTSPQPETGKEQAAGAETSPSPEAADVGPKPGTSTGTDTASQQGGPAATTSAASPGTTSSQAPPVPGATAPAAPRQFVTNREIIRMISDDAEKVTDTDRPNLRYFTFTHLFNAGEPEKSLRVYRMALGKLLNSLSTESDPVVPVAIDPAGTIFRVDISRLGWTSATWDNVVAADPYVVFFHNSQFRALQTELKTVVPMIRADWFVFAASRPPLYYTVLDLPKTKGELQKRLGLDVGKDFRGRRVERAGFQLSGVSDNNRMVERHAIGTGMYWESYDFGSNGDRKSIFQFPLGPEGAQFEDFGDKFSFLHDGGEIIFSLPNGFHAYYLTDGKGNRLDTGPTKIVRDPAQRDLAVTNGISCMGCHDKGIKFNDRRPGQPLDQIRDLVLKSGSYPPEAKEIVGEIFPTGEAFTKRLETDARRYADALSAADINVNTKDDGVEMVNALAKRFEENIKIELAAAELGMRPDEFSERLNAAGGQAYDLKLRLQQDIVPRDQFVTLFAPLLNTINDEGDKAIDLTKVAAKTGSTAAAVASQTSHVPTNSKTFDLAFYANATSFKVGDLVTFTLKSEQPCFLTLTDTDDKGQSTVLFPNGFHPDGRIPAGVAIQIPGDQIGGFKIRAPQPGTERITANCNASFDQSVSQDFSKAQFTTFQSTRDLISAQIDTRRRQQKEVDVRILSVEAAQPDVAKTDAVQVSKIANPTGLTPNPAEPLIPIVAQKSVVLQIKAH